MKKCTFQGAFFVIRYNRKARIQALFLPHYLILEAKSAIISLILMFCGQTDSQERQPTQAEGVLPPSERSAIGAINPPSEKLCSL